MAKKGITLLSVGLGIAAGIILLLLAAVLLLLAETGAGYRARRCLNRVIIT